MRIAVIQFPGSNCERETMLALQRAGMEPVEFLWNQPHSALATFAGYVLVGGFSYEDRARSGILAALDPLMQGLREASQQGKPVLGICNGAQILVEAGLVPGLEKNQVGLALTENKRIRQGKILGTGFYNAWVHLRRSDRGLTGAFARHLTPQTVLRLPIAHGEGRFIIPPALLEEIETRGLNLFQYCSESGAIHDEFPTNPNGSINNIAALSNAAGNVLAMMPHPERTTAGDAIFHSMRDYIREKTLPAARPLHYQAPTPVLESYRPTATAQELLIELTITDNQALSVKHVLGQRLPTLQLKRQTHWEIECDSPATYEKILASEVLHNKRKELALARERSPLLPQEIGFLVRAKEDMLGQQKKQILENHFGIQGIRALRHSVLWRVQARESLDLITHRVLQSQIFFNPYAHDCYYY